MPRVFVPDGTHLGDHRTGMTARLLLGLSVLFCTACAARSSVPPGEESAPAPDDLDALERDLSVQETRLAQALESRGELAANAPYSAAAPPPAAAPAPTPAPAEAAAAPKADDEDRRALEAQTSTARAPERLSEAEAPREDASPCETACRAVASMRRSAEAICRLTGATHARCQSAEQRVNEAAQRLSRARCSCR